MSLFSSTQSRDRFGLIIDIGSGSVLVSIVASSQTEAYPTILWAKREYVPLRTAESTSGMAKSVMTALMNALLEFESTGRHILQSYSQTAHITDMQVTVSAPWSYTVIKHITFQKDEPFTLTNDLLESLLETADKKIAVELHENEIATDLELSITQRTPLQIIANGYPITQIHKQITRNLSLAYASTIIQDHLATTIKDARNNVAPKSNLHISSFMLAYFELLRATHPHWNELALIDITFEATEIGIVRDGALHYCTHHPIGSQTLIKNISHITKQPATDVYSRLQDKTMDDFLALLPASHQPRVVSVFDDYVTALREIFTETGDVLGLPRVLAIHIEQACEPLFVPLIKEAANRVTKIKHFCHPVTSELVEQYYSYLQTKKLEPILIDTAMLASAQLFHNGYSPSGRSTLLRDILE